MIINNNHKSDKDLILNLNSRQKELKIAINQINSKKHNNVKIVISQSNKQGNKKNK